MLIHFKNGDKNYRKILKTIYFDETEDIKIDQQQMLLVYF